MTIARTVSGLSRARECSHSACCLRCSNELKFTGTVVHRFARPFLQSLHTTANLARCFASMKSQIRWIKSSGKSATSGSTCRRTKYWLGSYSDFLCSVPEAATLSVARESYSRTLNKPLTAHEESTKRLRSKGQPYY